MQAAEILHSRDGCTGAAPQAKRPRRSCRPKRKPASGKDERGSNATPKKRQKEKEKEREEGEPVNDDGVDVDLQHDGEPTDTETQCKTDKARKPRAERGDRVRVYPTAEQRATLVSWMGTVRWIYNECVHAVRAGRAKPTKEDLRDKFGGDEPFGAKPRKRPTKKKTTEAKKMKKPKKKKQAIDDTPKESDEERAARKRSFRDSRGRPLGTLEWVQKTPAHVRDAAILDYLQGHMQNMNRKTG